MRPKAEQVQANRCNYPEFPDEQICLDGTPFKHHLLPAYAEIRFKANEVARDLVKARTETKQLRSELETERDHNEELSIVHAKASSKLEQAAALNQDMSQSLADSDAKVMALEKQLDDVLKDMSFLTTKASRLNVEKKHLTQAIDQVKWVVLGALVGGIVLGVLGHMMYLSKYLIGE